MTVERPDGDVATLDYDGGGRLASRIVTRGGALIATQSTTKDAAGRVATVMAPNGIAPSHTYDGPLFLSETWVGRAAASPSG